MAALHSERRRRLGRECASYDERVCARRRVRPRKRPGRFWDCWPAATRPACSVQKGHRISDRRRKAPTAAGTKTLSTGTGFPAVFYLQYHLLPPLVPGAGLSEYLKTSGAERSRPIMRVSAFPGDRRYGDYIAKNKMRPRRSGRRTSRRRRDGSNPFRIVHPQIPRRRASASRIP